jgi:hypothetical protein
MRMGIDAIEARVKALGALRRCELAMRPGAGVGVLKVKRNQILL